MSFPFRLIDLTHTLSPDIPSWNGTCGFAHTIKLDYNTDEEISFRVQQIKMHAGIGTHLDAPAHCVLGGLSIESLALENFAAPCVLIDVSKKAHALFVTSVNDIKEFEKHYGAIQPGSIVVIRTGWEQFWNQPEKYRNDYHFPCVSQEAAEYLLEKGVLALGVDTLSPDRPELGFPVHNTFLGAGRYLIENLACTDKLPPTGSFIMCLPIKTLDGTEAPARCVGLVRR